MKQLLSLALTLFLFTATLPAQTVTFTAKAYPADMQRSVKSSMQMDLLLTVSGQGANQTMSMAKESRKQYTMTVLEATDAGMQKAALEYTEAYEMESSPMRSPKETDLDVDGKVFILEQTVPGGGDGEAVWTVSRENGDEVTEEEREYMLAQKETKMDKGLQRLLNGKTMSVGDTLHLDESALELMSSAGVPGNTEVREASLVLTGIGAKELGATAEFDVHFVLLGKTGVMDMTLTIGGKAVVYSASLWPLSMTFNGDMKGDSAHGGAKIIGDGLVEAAMESSYKLH